MGSIPPLSLGPPVVRPLRMTVVRPFGKRTLTVLPQAGAVESSRASSAAANLLMRVFLLGLKVGRQEEPPRMIARTGGRRLMLLNGGGRALHLGHRKRGGR